MSATQACGMILVALPIIGVAVACVRSEGWRGALLVLLGTCAIVVPLFLGVYLLEYDRHAEIAVTAEVQEGARLGAAGNVEAGL